MTTPFDDRSRTPAMFTSIARRYDLLNHVLSLNVDRRWRAALVESAGVNRDGAVLDVATGTSDVAIEFARRTDAAVIAGVDPAVGMLEVAREKLRARGLEGRVRLMEGDALALPFADGVFDAVTIAFGLRNLPDYRAGIEEMTRVLRPGGRLLVLEFFPPRKGIFLRGYRFYLGRILPVAGRIISGSPEAYRYLARSIEGFIGDGELRAYMGAAGLRRVRVRRLTGGVASIYTGVKKATAGTYRAPERGDMAKERVKILFVCIGNMCRSPMAEGFAREYGGEAVEVFSAGTHPTGVISEDSILMMEEREIDIAHQRSKSLADVPLADIDVVVSMAHVPAHQLVPKGFRGRTIDWDIDDPIGRSVSTFRRTRDEIEEKVRALLDEIRVSPSRG